MADLPDFNSDDEETSNQKPKTKITEQNASDILKMFN